jgi:hypothetical protein
MELAQKTMYHGLYGALLGNVSVSDEANIKFVKLVGEHSNL